MTVRPEHGEGIPKGAQHRIDQKGKASSPSSGLLLPELKLLDTLPLYLFGSFPILLPKQQPTI